MRCVQTSRWKKLMTTATTTCHQQLDVLSTLITSQHHRLHCTQQTDSLSALSEDLLLISRYTHLSVASGIRVQKQRLDSVSVSVSAC